MAKVKEAIYNLVFCAGDGSEPFDKLRVLPLIQKPCDSAIIKKGFVEIWIKSKSNFSAVHEFNVLQQAVNAHRIK